MDKKEMSIFSRNDIRISKVNSYYSDRYLKKRGILQSVSNNKYNHKENSEVTVRQN